MVDLKSIVEESSNNEDTSAHGADDLAIVTKEGRNITLARNETKAVSWLRVIVLLVLVAVAAAVSLAVYFFTRKEEVDDFETVFEDSA